MIFRRIINIFPLGLLFLLAAVVPSALGAQFGLQTQAEQEGVLKEIGVDERPGEQVPIGLAFTDQEGRAVRLGDYFAGKPVLLSLNYYECPMLCPVTFANLAKTMEDMKGLKPGKDFKILTVSISPFETAADASGKAEETYKMLRGYENPASWWPFLFGEYKSVRALTDAVGFRYKVIDRINIAHPSVLIVLTPEGKVSRYLYGIEHTPRDLRLALLEASRGEVGASAALNKILLFCYHYDPVGKKYVLAAARLMTGAAAVVLAALAALIFIMWKSEKRRGRA